MLCYPTDDDDAPADSQLHRDYFGMHRFEWHDDRGVVDAIEFRLRHGDMIRLLRSCGFEIEDLLELRAAARCRSRAGSVHPPRVGATVAERGDLEGTEGTPATLIHRWAVYV